MAALSRLVDPSHILFGSDFPVAPEPVTGMQTKALDELAEWDQAMREAVARRNALSLLPRLSVPGEHLLSETRPPASPDIRSRIKGVALRSVVRLVDRIRNR